MTLSEQPERCHNHLHSHCTLRVKLADPTPAALELVTWYTPESSLVVLMMAMLLTVTVTLLSLMVWLFLVHMKLSGAGGGLAVSWKEEVKSLPSKTVVGAAEAVYSGASAYKHVCTCMHVRMYVCTGVYMHACMYVCVYMCVQMCMHVGVDVGVYTLCGCVHVYVWMCVSLYVCVHLCVQ